MRITCKQCNRNIHSEQCAKYCDYNKRQKQFEEANKEVDKAMEKAFPNSNFNKR